MDRFRRLMQIVLLSGTVAGLALFVVQHLLVVPLIKEAETYEAAARKSELAGGHHAEAWQPSEGWERTAYTALGTVLMGLGAAAVLVGGAAFVGATLDVRRGMLAGLAGFACFALAPALGLPPGPPGTAVGDLRARQLWWMATAGLTAIGLWLVVRRRGTWGQRALGAICLVLPHVVGAPATGEPSVVPVALARHFAIASVATAGMFWMLLGATGGYLWRRGYGEHARRAERG